VACNACLLNINDHIFAEHHAFSSIKVKVEIGEEQKSKPFSQGLLPLLPAYSTLSPYMCAHSFYAMHCQPTQY
jgi:hypothetical protein